MKSFTYWFCYIIENPGFKFLINELGLLFSLYPFMFNVWYKFSFQIRCGQVLGAQTEPGPGWKTVIKAWLYVDINSLPFSYILVNLLIF